MVVRWEDVSTGRCSQYTSQLKLSISRGSGSIGEIATVIGAKEGNILNFQVGRRDADWAEAVLDVEVDSVEHLERIVTALRGLESVERVVRSGT